MDIALFGGTFNPVHYGHLRVAEEVRESLGLSKIVFVPTCITPHKPEEELTPPELRLEMLRLAVKDNPGFDVSDIEIRRGGRSYTIDTVRELKGESVEGTEISLIIGTDSFNDISSWHRYRELIEEVNLIVVQRPGYRRKGLDEVLPVELAALFWYDSKGGCFKGPAGSSIRFIETTRMDISSSHMRGWIKEGRSIRYLTPKAVEDFILQKGLYR